MKRNTTIWFVCAGNICRSVIAEYAFRALVRKHELPVDCIASAGVIAIPGDVPIADTLRAARKAGLDLSAHRAHRFSADDINAESRIFVMEHGQQAEVLRLTGLSTHEVQLLGALVPATSDEIADPENQPEAGFDACVARIVACVTTLAEQIANEAKMDLLVDI